MVKFRAKKEYNSTLANKNKRTSSSYVPPPTSKSRCRCRLLSCGLLLAALQFLVVWSACHSSFTFFMQEAEEGDGNQRRKIEHKNGGLRKSQRRSTTHAVSSLANDCVVNSTLQNELVKDVLRLKRFLVELQIPLGALSRNPDNGKSYVNVTGKFCAVDWTLQKQSPLNAPQFKDLLEQSPGCNLADIMYRYVDLDIRSIVTQARTYDDHHPIRTLPVGGLIVHESRCGSTLAANLIVASSPVEHRVYAEAGPPDTIYRQCAQDEMCDWNKAQELLADVLYLMGRSNNPNEQRVFYKLGMDGALGLGALWKGLNIPWAYLFRDSVDVYQSHYDGDEKLRHRNRAACLKVFTRERIPSLLDNIAKQHHRDMHSLSNMEACGVHLAALNEAALHQHQEHGDGHFVDYETMPHAMWNHVLPNVFGIPLSASQIERMKEVSGFYSKKARGKLSDIEWSEGRRKRAVMAPQEVQRVANEFMAGSYAKLNEIAWRGEDEIVV